MSTVKPALSILASLHEFAHDVAVAVLGGHHAPEGMTALLEIRDGVVYGVIAASHLDGGRQIDHLRWSADLHYDVDLPAAERAGVKFVGTARMVEDPQPDPQSPELAAAPQGVGSYAAPQGVGSYAAPQGARCRACQGQTASTLCERELVASREAVRRLWCHVQAVNPAGLDRQSALVFAELRREVEALARVAGVA